MSEIDQGTTHVKALEPETLVLSLVMSALSAVICMQIIAQIGISANTSIMGALLAMALARIPFANTRKFRSLDRQNLIQTMCSGAGFAASNCGILSVGIFYVMGQQQYAYYMVVGGLIATLLSVLFVYRVFDSALFPASASWAPGIATAEALYAGDQGGKRARRLLEGVVVGIIGGMIKIPAAWIGIPGTATYGIPGAGIGIVFLANIWSMGALSVGLLLRAYLPVLTGFDLGKTYIPHGLMIGAGLASLVQIVLVLYRNIKSGASSVSDDEGTFPITVAPGKVKTAIWQSFLLYAVAATALALVSGVLTGMSAPTMALWVLWCALSCVLAPMLVGLCAMRSGWFPGFAVSTIFLMFGMFMGFPMIALAVLTGFVACTGPCFADMGYDMKTGWILRGRNANIPYELDGRRQQFIAEIIGGVVGFTTVALFMNMYFKLDMVPPLSRVFATTVQAMNDPGIIFELAKWSVLGAAIQFVMGAKRAVGILFATGLLIYSPMYGIAVFLSVIVRIITGNKWMEIREAGLIAGDGIYGFLSALVRVI